MIYQKSMIQITICLIAAFFVVLPIPIHADSHTHQDIATKNFWRSSITPTLDKTAVNKNFKNFPIAELRNYAEKLENGKLKVADLEPQRLTKDEVIERLPGKTYYGISNKGNSYALLFNNDGTAPAQMADGRKETGIWQVDENGLITTKWPTLHDRGKPIKVYYHATNKDGLLIKEAADGISLMIEQKDDPERLGLRK